MKDAGRLAAVVESLRRHPRLGPQVVHAVDLPGQQPRFADLEPPLLPAIAGALASDGAPRLWSHQAEGIVALRRGENVLLTTPTASGKSLVFHLPMIEEAACGGSGRALLLYPLKALAQDQRGKLEALARGAGVDVDCALYDGDTAPAVRARLRRRPPRVLVTNPDMLHLGILPSWPTWGPFLADLRWVVLDELHSYRGIFGSHLHHVLARLLRLCRELGARPQVVASSATAANAEDFASALTGLSFHRIADSGAPRETRHLLLVQPSGSPYTTALQILVELLRAGQKAIVFTKARRITELLFAWLRRQEPELATRVACYRAGFLPEERRQIEARLFRGELQGVISTSALELGIDVGGLDACILVGWPGSVMATWQRSGRVGRQGRESLTALVALPDALDQWLVRHPGELLARPCEPLLVNAANEVVARQHLPCAAAELPLERDADRGYLERHAAATSQLVAAHQLRLSEDGATLFARRRRPQRQVSLRGGGEAFAIVEARSQRTIGTIDAVRVRFECHPGAIYLHAGRQFLVRELDIATATVLVESAGVDWFTAALAEKDTRILEVLAERHDGPLSAWLGSLRVTERVVGYERKRVSFRDRPLAGVPAAGDGGAPLAFGQQVLSRHRLELPPVVYETVGIWWAATPALEEELARRRLAATDGPRAAMGELTLRTPPSFLGALHAAEHAAISLLPLLALCDRGDIGGISTPFHPQVGCAAVFVYEAHAGGVGIAAQAFQELPALLGRVRRLLAECPCEGGCPSCVHSPKCGNGNRPLDKEGALRAMAILLGEDPLPGVNPRWTLRLEEGSSEEEPRAPSASSASDALLRRARRGGSPRSATPPRREELPCDGADAAPVAIAAVAPRPPGELPRRRSQARTGPRPPRRARPLQPTRPPTVAPPCPDLLAPVGRLTPPPSPPSTEPALGWLGRVVRDLWRSWRRPGRPTIASARTRGGTVLFDLETLRSAADVGGWGNAHRMGLALAVLCHLEEERLEVYREADAQALSEALRAARLVVGFNVRRFDYRVLAGYTGADYDRLVPTLDLLDEVHRALGFRLRLDDLARATLGTGKSADGLQSLAWVREGRLDLVEAYCRRDVEVLRDLYLFGRREGYVLWRDRERRLRLPVRW